MLKTDGTEGDVKHILLMHKMAEGQKEQTEVSVVIMTQQVLSSREPPE